MKQRRWWTQQLGLRPQQRPRARTWRSNDLAGPLPAATSRALAAALGALPRRAPWPEADEESWWHDVLHDPRARLPRTKRLAEKAAHARLRLDRLPVKSITFSCRRCGAAATLSIEQLIATFGRDYNVRAIGSSVLACGDKRARREGYECPVTYQA